ncbi:4TM region of DNA translocase FtsK/SpoIIIE [Oceanospirillum multiglobuliferum]|uniref:DNA translocase FtsK 4TM region domain-containing protein n=1 Tax=Oceanospirillum multiglobuliferum TaxID=64969 RepID=A0A1T4MI31_9GAMM|nr:DNA translocase FtsK 4TM domain-containing protein [Oceanospirillum multiglobuliferum]OPX57021.1 hypothetical protein BTE48_00900 [Oceanospirillum multiglobuliferum]SJZ66418.1 4TM region of DNA translocase FtsK/SpoIIIE [Oceanospirillum multiglobuliferum]
MATNPKLSPEPQELAQAQMLSKILQDSQQVLSFLLASAVMLALLSHDLQDGGWSITAENATPQNWLGSIGVYLSDLLLSIMGYAAYWLPIALYYKVLRYLMQHYNFAPNFAHCLNDCLKPPHQAIASFAFILLLVATASLAGLHFYHPNHGLPHAVGGIVGESLTVLLLHSVGAVVATLFVLALWLTGLTFSIGIPWLRLMDEIGFYAEKSVLHLFRWGQTESRESRAGLPENYAVDDQLSPFSHFKVEEDEDADNRRRPYSKQKKSSPSSENLSAKESESISADEYFGAEASESERSSSPTQGFWQQLSPLFKGTSSSDRNTRFERVEPDFSLDESLTFDASTFAEPKLSEITPKAEPLSSVILEENNDDRPSSNGAETIEMPDPTQSTKQAEDSLQQALTQLIQQQAPRSEAEDRNKHSK